MCHKAYASLPIDEHTAIDMQWTFTWPLVTIKQESICNENTRDHSSRHYKIPTGNYMMNVLLFLKKRNYYVMKGGA